MLSPTAASVSFSSSGGSLWLNSTCGAVWLARRPSLNSYQQKSGERLAQRLLKRTSAFLPSHLHENLADDDVVVVLEHRAEDHRHPVFLGLHIPDRAEGVRQIRVTAKAGRVIRSCSQPRVHGLVVSVVDHGPLLAFFTLFLELEVLLKHRGEAVSFQHPCLVDGLVFIGW